MSDYLVPYITIGVFYGAIYRFIIRQWMIKEFMNSDMPIESKAQILSVQLKERSLFSEAVVAVFLIIIWPILFALDCLTLSLSLIRDLK